MIERHLRRVNPRLRGAAMRVAVQQAFDSYARYYVESFRLPCAQQAGRSTATSPSTGSTTSPTPSSRATACILALPHLGGWEWAGRWMTDQGFKITVVVEALEPPELFEWFADLRKELGMTVVPTGAECRRRGGEGAASDNEIVCLLCDRDIERNGVDVEFFGERTTLPAGPATLGLRIGAPRPADRGVLHTSRTTVTTPSCGRRLPIDPLGGLRDDVARITQLLAHELEFLIRRAPEQWHLFQPNWPSDPGY